MVLGGIKGLLSVKSYPILILDESLVSGSIYEH